MCPSGNAPDQCGIGVIRARVFVPTVGGDFLAATRRSIVAVAVPEGGARYRNVDSGRLTREWCG